MRFESTGLALGLQGVLNHGPNFFVVYKISRIRIRIRIGVALSDSGEELGFLV